MTTNDDRDGGWVEYARLVLKGLESSEAASIIHSSEITDLKARVKVLEVLIKIMMVIMVPLVVDAIKSYFGG